MEDIKPIKRSRELAPLSREHHDGLQFVWKVRKGLENKTPVETIGKYVRWFWTNHIKPHFKDEEKVLVKHLPADNPLVNQMKKEHAQIRDIIISLDHQPEKNDLVMLVDILQNHIRFEERQLFKYAEETLSAEQLNAIYNQLSNEFHCDTEWKDEFWIKK